MRKELDKIYRPWLVYFMAVSAIVQRSLKFGRPAHQLLMMHETTTASFVVVAFYDLL